MEPEWRDQYNIVRVPHVTWPSKLGTQLKLEGPVTCDLDWMTYKALREQWQIWTKAFSYYLLDNTKKAKQGKLDDMVQLVNRKKDERRSIGS